MAPSALPAQRSRAYTQKARNARSVCQRSFHKPFHACRPSRRASITIRIWFAAKGSGSATVAARPAATEAEPAGRTVSDARWQLPIDVDDHVHFDECRFNNDLVCGGEAILIFEMSGWPVWVHHAGRDLSWRVLEVVKPKFPPVGRPTSGTC